MSKTVRVAPTSRLAAAGALLALTLAAATSAQAQITLADITHALTLAQSLAREQILTRDGRELHYAAGLALTRLAADLGALPGVAVEPLPQAA